ncbi:MAG: PCMD domain-containing protein [Bacteroidales bacterium]|nr:PCMD domain-containing protein [Bacteroidales bacterium]
MKKIYLLIVSLIFATGLHAQSGPQLYNMSFDHWSKKKAQWCPWEQNGPQTWDTANKGLSILGKNGALPEDEKVAVKGPGKRAAKVQSMNVVWAFAAGALYTGDFVRIVNFSGAELAMGVPFTARPKSLDGYYWYTPGKINHAKAPYEDMMGKTDVGQIEVILADWDSPQTVCTNTGQFIDVENDPHIIGRGNLYLTKDSKGYVKFSLPIEYRSDRTPKYVVITTASSRYGSHFTGADGSVLYLDEFEFVY